MKTCAALLLILSLSCATAPRYDMARDTDGNVIVTRHKADHPGSTYAWIYAALIVATVADVETTFHAMERCATCSEANPIMRPFVKRGRGPTYAALFSLSAFQMWLAHRAQARGDAHWYIGPVIGAGVHGAAAVSNSRQ